MLARETDAMSPTASSPSVSARMSRQGSRDTQPELTVRRLLHADGLRYRVQFPVPGMPRRSMDIAFSKLRIAVFLDGCYWHGCPEHATHPRANAEWWRAKLDRNIARDRETTDHLAAVGWVVMRFWEHEAADDVARRIEAEVLSRRSASGGS